MGGNGFIGGHLVEHYRRSGVETHIFSRSRNYINTDGAIENSLLNSEIIIWAASTVNPQSAENHPGRVDLEILRWNKFLMLLENNSKFFGTIIFLSSGGCVYSGDADPFNESDLAKGNNAYGRMKISMEDSLRSRNLPWQILRLANVYGPDQPYGRGQGVLAEWLHALDTGEPIRLFGSKDSYRDYIHINDVVDAIRLVSQLNKKNETFNIGTGQRITLKYLYQLFTGNLQSQASTSEVRDFDRSGYTLDIGKIQDFTGWAPTVSIETGINLINRRIREY